MSQSQVTVKKEGAQSPSKYVIKPSWKGNTKALVNFLKVPRPLEDHLLGSGGALARVPARSPTPRILRIAGTVFCLSRTPRSSTELLLWILVIGARHSRWSAWQLESGIWLSLQMEQLSVEWYCWSSGAGGNYCCFGWGLLHPHQASRCHVHADSQYYGRSFG